MRHGTLFTYPFPFTRALQSEDIQREKKKQLNLQNWSQSNTQQCLSTFTADASVRFVFIKKISLTHIGLEQDFYLSGIARTETVPQSSSKLEHAIAAYQTITTSFQQYFLCFLPILVVVSYKKQVMIH